MKIIDRLQKLGYRLIRKMYQTILLESQNVDELIGVQLVSKQKKRWQK